MIHQPPHHDAQTDDWARSTLEKVALASIKEQRRARRWKIFFTLLFFGYLFVIAYLIFGQTQSQPSYDILGNTVAADSQDHIALIKLSGVIAGDEDANANALSALIRRTAAEPQVKAILIEANSPGGSPVQSSLVYKTIQDVKETYSKPIKTVVTDMCASGCYYIVSASDEIYADESSIVGSIGVISQSFGYQEAAEKLGIQPRTYTAGENKDFMNPAREPSEKEIAFMQDLLDDLHANFIAAVKAGRGDKLADDPDLFSGLFWTAETAQTLGLIDGIATPQGVAAGIGDYPVYDYSIKPPFEQWLDAFGARTERIISGSLQQLIESKNTINFQ